ncbi:MAG: FHA domain-containing serine/threonine-protein kinase [Planctomycetota bacterium]
MPKLIVENGHERGKTFVISQEGPFFGGRDPAAQVSLRDEMASRRHFQIESKNGGFYVRDLGSSNGTQLNGSLLTSVKKLSSNDRITCGETVLTFVDEHSGPLLDTEIAGYRIIEKVGRGGMGTVYRAIQTSLDREVALKILASHLVKNTSFINLFIREARAAGALSHPNIVQVYDVGVQDNIYFFSMEFITAGSVEDIIHQDGIVRVAKALRITRDAALGLEYAESKGIVHRDIKPGNLMVGAGGAIKIGDLGIARSTEGDGSVSQKDGVSGSPHYIAPEQAQGKDIDCRVDLYSLGISLYQMLCGKTPFSGSTPREVILKHIKEQPEPLRDRNPEVPEDVAQLVHHMIAKNREQRIGSARELLQALVPLLERYPESGAPVVRKEGSAKKALMTLIGALVLVAVVAAVTVGYKKVIESRDAEKQRLVALSNRVGELEQLVAANDHVAVRNMLRELDNEELSAELEIRLESARGKFEDGLAAEAAAAREREATAALETLTGEWAPPPTAEQVASLRQFAKDNAGTAAAGNATQQADQFAAAIVAEEERVEDANESAQGLLRVHDTYRDTLDFHNARLELLKFDTKTFAATEAANRVADAMVALEDAANRLWEQRRPEIQRELDEQGARVARRSAQRFLKRAGFPALRQEVEAFIEEIDGRPKE